MRYLPIALAAAGVLAHPLGSAAQVPCPAPLILEAVVTTETPEMTVTLREGATLDGDEIAGTISVDDEAAQSIPGRRVQGSRRRFEVVMPQLYPAGTTIEYTMTAATFSCTGAMLPESFETTVPEHEVAIDEILGRVAHARTQDERSLFGSFFAARGEGGTTTGAADVIINHDLTRGGLPNVGALFDSAFATLRVKKTSAENADPRAFDISVTFEKTRLIGGAAEYLRACSGQAARLTCEEARDSLQRRPGFFRTFLFDETLRLESDAFGFESVNFVSDTHAQLGSIAKSLGGAGYASLRLHLGAEIGRNLQKPLAAAGTPDVTTSAVDWVRRGKAGGEFTLRLLPGGNSGNTWAVELTARTVFRRLWSDEVFIEEVTDEQGESVPQRIGIGSGWKPWRQFDAKLLLFATENARYGLRLAYMNGSLPPAFKPTRGFTFGFVVETADDRSDGESASSDR